MFHAVLLVPSVALAGELPPPLTDADFHAADPEKARIGQLLFYDPVLSGNRNISCATCHHHTQGSSDGLSLGVGEGGRGVGPDRTLGDGPGRIAKRVPRNAQGLWNLGAKEIRVMFHDGRLSVSDLYGNGFDSPAEEWLPDGVPSILAAQALFPLVAEFEMAGNTGENEVAGAINDRIDYAWPILAGRVAAIPAYAEMFAEVFPGIETPGDITIVHVAEAIAAFIGAEWRNHDSPFDAFLAGDAAALSGAARRGMELFYGRAGCDGCHAGPLMSDQAFHALGLPAFGPGRTRRFDPMPRDTGRMAETDRLEDAYRFRTPMLRNVALTAPYGHNGAWATLADAVRHHANPAAALADWAPGDAKLPPAPWLAAVDFAIREDAREMARQAARLDIAPVALSEAEVADLVAFLEALTGRTAADRPLGRPGAVPSGLPVD